MNSPLINRLIDELGYPLLDDDNFEGFIEQTPISVLFLTEDPKRFPESLDVAVILPELIKQFPQLTPAVVSEDIQTACRVITLWRGRHWCFLSMASISTPLPKCKTGMTTYTKSIEF